MYFVRIAFWFAIFGASTVKYRITAPYYGNGPDRYPQHYERNQPLRMGEKSGGEGGIRPPDTLSGMPVFKTGAINHSATSPYSYQTRRAIRRFWLVYNRGDEFQGLGSRPNALE